MKHTIGKLLLPVVLLLVGIALNLYAIRNDQNWQFLTGSLAVVIAAIIFILLALSEIRKIFRIFIFSGMIGFSIFLSLLNIQSIKEPIDFLKEKKKRYAFVIQRLKDIRQAELAYKAVKNKYTNNFDSLLYFVKMDSLSVVKAVGFVPDTLTEEQAIKMKLVSRDTFFVLVIDSIFSPFYLKNRKYPFHIDSIPYIPFTDGARFRLEAGEVENNKVTVKVFMAVDAEPFDKRTVLQVGSMSEPSTSGNWGE